MRRYQRVVQRFFPSGSRSPEDDRLRYLVNRYKNVPCPQGDFSSGCAMLSSLEGITLTPYGFESLSESSHFELDKDSIPKDARIVKISLQFTSFPVPLSARLVVSTEANPSKAADIIPMRHVGSGRIETEFTITSPITSIKLYPSTQPIIFVIHELSLHTQTYADLVKKVANQKSKKYGVLCFPVIDWEYRFQRPQHLCKQFALHGHEVFYLSVHFSGLEREVIEERSLSERVTGLKLPGNSRYNIYRDIPSANSVQTAVRLLERYFLERDCNDVVMIVDLPFWLPYAKLLKERHGWPIVYDCMDDHSGFENNRPAMLALEDETTGTADLLVVSSQLLADKKSPLNENCILVRNAADYEHFSRDIPREESPLKNLTGPVIGYYGAVAEWFDWDAVTAAVHRHPEWNFVIIGHVHERTEAIRALESKENVHFYGEIPYNDLPSYLAGFDICTIPFRRIPLTEATNPVKVYEYLAAGKLIVARELPELLPLKDQVRLYSTAEQFVTQLENAVASLPTVDKTALQKVAFENRWQDRFRMLESGIKDLFPRVSIIIVSYHQLQLLQNCLDSIFSNTQYPDYEVVIVDNGSEPEVTEFLSLLAAQDPERVRVVLNGENKGFAGANNIGLRLANAPSSTSSKGSEYFVLLNNDTVVPHGWLERLIWHASRPEVGIVGPVSNCIGNEAQIPVHYMNDREMMDFSRKHCATHLHEHFEIKTLAMFCLAFRKEVFDAIGLLDEQYSIGMFEDDDYAERVRAAGYKVVCAEDSFVHHIGSASFSKLEKAYYQELFERNKKIFESKWGTWVPHQYR